MSLAFAQRMNALNPSPTLALDARIKQMRADGIDVISFGVGEPDFDTPVNIREAGKRSIDEGFTRYTPSGGIEPLKAAIAARIKKDCGADVGTNRIIISSGAKHSLFNIALTLYGPGDEVIIPSPYWVSYPEQVAIADAVPVFVQGHAGNDFKATVADIEKAVTPRTKALILNTPSNPTGMVYSAKEMDAILALVRKHEFYLVVDEIYDKLVYSGGFAPVLSLIKGDRVLEERVIVVNGVSKSYAMTGWRIGWIVADPKVVKAMDNLQSQSTSNPTSIAQKAAIEALNGPQDDVAAMVREFGARRDLIVKLLSAIPGITVKNPDGAFYVFPDVTGVLGRKHGGTAIATSLDLCGYLLDEARIGVVPGEAFGAPGYARLSFATSRDNITAGIGRMAAAIAKLA